jgi:type I restriction enzyme M protein
LPEVKAAIFGHAEFTAFNTAARERFTAWRATVTPQLTAFDKDGHPKALIETIAESLLDTFKVAPLLDAYDVYQHLMDFWDETMQDDCYLIAADGWKVETYRVIETKKGKDGKPGKQVDKGWACDLVPKELLVARYYSHEQEEIEQLAAKVESIDALLEELEQEQIGDEDAFGDARTEAEEGKDGKVTRATVTARLKQIKGDKEAKEEAIFLSRWIKLDDEQSTTRKKLRDTEAALDSACLARYPNLSEAEIKILVVDDKWISALDKAVHGEMDSISHALANRVRELAERYGTPLPEMIEQVAELESKVNHHLERMGFAWS